MNKKDIEQKVINIITENYSKRLGNIKITKKTDLINDLGYDSISIMQTIIECEKNFNVMFDDSFFDNDNFTIEKIVKYLVGKVNEI